MYCAETLNIILSIVIDVHFVMVLLLVFPKMWRFPHPFGFCNPVRIYGRKINDDDDTLDQKNWVVGIHQVQLFPSNIKFGFATNELQRKVTNFVVHISDCIQINSEWQYKLQLYFIIHQHVVLTWPSAWNLWIHQWEGHRCTCVEEQIKCMLMQYTVKVHSSCWTVCTLLVIFLFKSDKVVFVLKCSTVTHPCCGYYIDIYSTMAVF